MNKKSRLLLPTIGLVVLSGIAATSTTFAWFTTVRSATVDFTKAKVVSTDASLSITHHNSLNSHTQPNVANAGEALTVTQGADGDGINFVTYSGTPTVTDISGDGVTFYKPVWAVAGVTASAIPALTLTDPGHADGKLIDITIKVSRSDAPGAEGINIYLGSGTKIEPANDPASNADELAVAGARMAVATVDADGSNHTKLFVHSPEEEKAAPNGFPSQYIGSGTSAYGVNGVQVKTDLAVKHAPFETKATNTDAVATGYPVLAELKGSEADAGDRVVDAYINFRFWVEGEDIDTKNSMQQGEFKVTLDLYALAHNAG